MVLIDRIWTVCQRVVVRIALANELWYETRPDGERSYHILRFGFADRDGQRIWSLHVFGLVVRVGW